jgi:NADPH2 dehydrogenase
MTSPFKLVRVPSLKTVEAFRTHLKSLGLELGMDDEMVAGDSSPLRQTVSWQGRTIGNRWAIHPMEGWDGTTSGGVTEPMIRRWQRFGESGAKLIWGGEAMAVRADGRANPNQLILNRQNRPEWVS